MTSVFMIIEVSGNYSIILPVMISNTIAYLLSRRFQHAPLFDVLGKQDGTDLPSMEEQRETELSRVEDAMRLPAGVTLVGHETVTQSVVRAAAVSSDYFLVPLNPGVWGGVSRSELTLLNAREDAAHRPLADLLPPIALPYLYPDQSIEFALRVLHDRLFVPVVHRADGTRLVGLLTLEDVVRVYRGSA
jgi:CIC family chloride channel protein